MAENSSHLSPATSQGVILDIGTGDGRFVYRMARNNPARLYIGIDASSEALVKVSEKIYRNPKHGGAKNALFLQARVEELPEDLTGIADEVHVHFPWGSLLGSLLKPDDAVLCSLRRVLKPQGLIEVVTSIDGVRDAGELYRLGIAREINDAYVEEVLRPAYGKAGIDVTEHGQIAPDRWPSLCTSWAARLKSGKTRSVRYLIGQAL